MNAITVVILIFSMLGALDRIFGNKFGLGAEFERGFQLFGAMALSMIGMLIIAPALGIWLKPVFEGFYNLFHIDPSIIPASLFANDMGGASLATELAKDRNVGMYNAYVVSSMMGCVISFTIPFGASVVPNSQHKDMFFGFLCGIVTIPVGCFVAGFMFGLSFLQILINLLPLILISGAITAGIIFAPNLCVKILCGFGTFMKVIITIGLALGIFIVLTGKTLVPSFDTFDSAAKVCVNASITLSGAFPFVYVVGKILKKPATALGSKIGINSTSTLALITNLVSNSTTFGMMRNMDKKGVVLNSAFAVSAAFVFGSHLGFTMGLEPSAVVPMIVGKLVAGVASVVLAMIVYKGDKEEKNSEKETNITEKSVV